MKEKHKVNGWTIQWSKRSLSWVVFKPDSTDIFIDGIQYKSLELAIAHARFNK